MKSRTLHALAILCSASFVACKTSGGTGTGKSVLALDPGTKVGEVDGKAITYGDVQNDHEVGPKLRQAEVKVLTELYEQRRGLIEEMITRRLDAGGNRGRGGGGAGARGRSDCGDGPVHAQGAPEVGPELQPARDLEPDFMTCLGVVCAQE